MYIFTFEIKKSWMPLGCVFHSPIDLLIRPLVLFHRVSIFEGSFFSSFDKFSFFMFLDAGFLWCVTDPSLQKSAINCAKQNNCIDNAHENAQKSYVFSSNRATRRSFQFSFNLFKAIFRQVGILGDTRVYQN